MQVDVLTTHLEHLKPVDAVLNVLNAVPTKTQLLKCWQCLFNALDLSTAVADHHLKLIKDTLARCPEKGALNSELDKRIRSAPKLSQVPHLFPSKAAEVEHKQAQSCERRTVCGCRREGHAIPAEVQAA